MVSTRMIPARRNAALYARSAPAMAPGMGGRGLSGPPAAPRLNHDDGFDPGHGAGRAHKSAVLGQVLHVDDDAPGLLFVPQIIDQVAEIDVRHGTDADEVAEADLLGMADPRMELHKAPLWEMKARLPGWAPWGAKLASLMMGKGGPGSRPETDPGVLAPWLDGGLDSLAPHPASSPPAETMMVAAMLPGCTPA